MGTSLCVLIWDELKKEILDEAHSFVYAMHFESTKMYHILQEFYWWLGKKREIAKFVVKYLVC